ncbi:hypothetical protein BKA64DRAFT_737202 [Cadophora sp. MPI-SDFR-AT-0126]|nr:hypothetical protein BKA64DRAFT_737202 [Leotiomycetes sp. MPI-SDFR-AT-0126]
MPLKSSLLSSKMAKLVISKPAPKNTGSEIPDYKTQYFTERPIASPKQNARPAPEASLKSVPVLEPRFPAQIQVMGLLQPVIQAVLDDIVKAVGIPGSNPKLIIRDNWAFSSAYSYWNTINMPLGQLLYFKSLGSLAYVLAHELGHILTGHQAEGNAVFNRYEYIPELFKSRMQWCHGRGNIGEMMYINETRDIDAVQKEFCAFSRLGEHEADCIGMFMMAKAGFDPREALAFAREMERHEPEIFKTTRESLHPQWQNRITILESQLDARDGCIRDCRVQRKHGSSIRRDA